MKLGAVMLKEHEDEMTRSIQGWKRVCYHANYNFKFFFVFFFHRYSQNAGVHWINLYTIFVPMMANWIGNIIKYIVELLYTQSANFNRD